MQASYFIFHMVPTLYLDSGTFGGSLTFDHRTVTLTAKFHVDKNTLIHIVQTNSQLVSMRIFSK